MTEPHYLLTNAAAETEARFDGLAATFDPLTIGHLEPLVRPGARCLEVGAGSGSVARWMAGAAGPTGRVLATDLDVRWISASDAPFEVQQHDLANDPIPDGPWDVIHERLVLMHVPARLEVLDRLTAALAPGGWLVLEDFDTAEVRTTDRRSPDHELIARVAVAFNELIRSRGAATSFAADARRHLAERGLVDLDSSGYVAFAAGGSGFARVIAANTRQVHAGLVAGGLAEEELGRFLTALDDPTNVIGSPVLITTRGRRPA